jgi:uncharacterized protein YndB with AHSA1/START domain
MSTTAIIEENNIKLQVTRVFDAPRELVFRAWTDAKQFEQWFGAAACEGSSLQSAKLDARVGGKYRIQVRRADGEYFTTVGVYREVRPPERLVFTWQFEKDGGGDDFGEVEPPEMLVTLDFKARGKQTELVLTHERFASAESRDRHHQGWSRCLEQLSEYVGKANTGPAAAGGPGKDWLGHEFVITREFDAPRELVFKAWTDPKHLAHWWGPTGFTNPVCQWDARPGGKIYDVMRAPDGTDYPMGGEFREIVPPERLVLMCGALDDKGKFLFEFLHTATFTERNDKTTLTLNSRVLKTTAEANKYIGGFETGMTLSLVRLANLAQTREPLVVERTINAPAARVWQAITTREEMGRWFFELDEFKAKAGFEFSFAVMHEGFNYDHRCKVVEAIPNKKLAFTWRYASQAGDSLVTIELFAEGNQTRVKLAHTGLETFPAIPAFARVNFMGGWTCIIGSALGDYVENADREIFLSRDFSAPRELVWEAWTNPEHVVHWWGPRGFTTTVEKMDVRPGGVWKHVMHGPDGANYPNKSVFKEVVKPERIVFSHGGGREGGPGAHFVASWTFDEIDQNQTRVSLRLVFPSAEDRDVVIKEFGAIEGGKQTLERLAEHLVQMEAVLK